MKKADVLEFVGVGLLLVLFLLPSVTFAANTGFMVHGACYPDSGSASLAAMADFPLFSGNLVTSASSVTYNGSTFDEVIISRDLTTGALYNATVSASFPGCDPALTVSPLIDSGNVLATFSWGFGVVLFFWSMGFGIAAAKEVIARV